MHLLSWNIQFTKGCDGKFDAARILTDITKEGIPDVICLQEVSRFFPDYGNDDQLSFFKDAFPDHEAIWAPAMSGSLTSEQVGRSEFGNLTLVRRPILLDYRLHVLPSPIADHSWQMPRVAIETHISFRNRSLCLINTHLAYHVSKERMEQAK